MSETLWQDVDIRVIDQRIGTGGGATGFAKNHKNGWIRSRA